MSVVETRTDEGVLYVLINRPDVNNALNPAVFDRLSDVWDEFQDSDALEVAIVRGAGGNFSAGFDLQESIYEAFKEDAPEEWFESVGGLARGKTILKPVIAAVEGWCVAGGFEFALACDLRVADETTKFGLFHVREGMPNGDGGSVRLPLIAGLGNAMELSLTGKHVTAQRARDMNIVNRVAPEGEVMDYAEKYAEMIKRMPTEAVQAQKQTILETLAGCGLKDMLQREFELSYGGDGIYGEQGRTPELIEQFFSGEMDDKADRLESIDEAFDQL